MKPLPPQTQDKTDYARRWLGYVGKRRVLVSDGKVVSHGNQDWFLFCNECRRRFKRRTRFQSMLCQAYKQHLDKIIHAAHSPQSAIGNHQS